MGSEEISSNESYESSNEEAIDDTNVVNRNLNPPFTEVNEINLHNQHHGSQIEYDKEAVSQSISQSQDPFKRDEVYVYSSQKGFGPQSLLPNWDPLIGYELYSNWLKMMKAQRMQNRLDI